ncbi:MAG: anthranilate synthase component I [Polyangiaceae bacterium UTPRO1]|jgi:anthranilate synthase component 1|nr:anthranilate synthase component I [Myxococcales bacterium]OQY65910.1 MAG: anthranilate synthase component I [Polyangiaceae bacterium UTPRO1]
MSACTPSLADFLDLSRRGNLVPVFREILADTETPVSAFLKTTRGEHAFLLESVVGGDKWGRYSFLGSEPSAVFASRGTTVSLAEHGKPLRTYETADPLDALRAILAGYRAVPVAGLPRFFGGAVGYVAYDAVRFFERLPSRLPDPLGLPELYFIVPASLLVFDTIAQSIKVVVNVDLRDPEIDPRAAYEAATARIDELVARLAAPLTLPEALPTTGERLPVAANMTAAEYGAIVERAKEYIRAGDIIQVVLAQRLEAELRAAPFDVYRALRTVNPSPYMFYLHLGEQTLVGSSPEVMARVEDGELTVRPIAGTSPRGTQEAEDRELERKLLTDPKEIAEHIMLLDLGRNDVGRVAEAGSVEVTERLVIERYSHVMHIVSNVRGKLAAGRDCFDAFRATFPAGTLSGAPKIRAMEIIEELEPVRRGVYGGAIGYFGFGGTMDTCIAIRTMLIKNGKVYLQAGAGIVADSDPVREHAECLNKARGLLLALQRAERLAPDLGERVA